jgi:hypothetical protein
MHERHSALDATWGNQGPHDEASAGKFIKVALSQIHTEHHHYLLFPK